MAPDVKQAKVGYVCEFEGCSKSFARVDSMVRHRRTHTAIKSYSCTFESCDKLFSTSQGLRAHSRIHSGEKSFSCTFENCGKQFAQNDSLIAHQRIHTGLRPFVCPIETCKKSFSVSKSLIRHKLSHISEKNYVCEFNNCNKAFGHANLLVAHARTHTREKKIICEFDGCLAAFASSGELASHVRTHTQHRPFICQECSKAFTQMCALNVHKRVHSGLKRFICHFANCTMMFAESSDLIKHQRTHTKDRPHKCQICTRSFRQSGALTDHMRRDHTNEKLHICDVKDCNMAFATRSNLTNHKRTHSDEKRFACIHCSFRTKTKGNLREHLKRHEAQKSYAHECKMQDCGTQLWSEGDVKCSIRTRTERDMDIHIERNHTKEGIGRKLHSETQLAKFLDSLGVAYDRDWANFVQFKLCKNMEGNHFFARPDFYLPELSALLNAIVLIGNDEHAHRQYACDFQRLWNIVNALDQHAQFKSLPVLYVRFNPHYYKRNGVHFSQPLDIGHAIMWKTLKSIKPEDLKPGVNLVYIHYDRTDGTLDIFKDEENDFAKIYKDCVLLDV